MDGMHSGYFRRQESQEFIIVVTYSTGNKNKQTKYKTYHWLRRISCSCRIELNVFTKKVCNSLECREKHWSYAARNLASVLFSLARGMHYPVARHNRDDTIPTIFQSEYHLSGYQMIIQRRIADPFKKT